MNVEYLIRAGTTHGHIARRWNAGTLTGRWYLDRDGIMWVEITTSPAQTTTRSGFWGGPPRVEIHPEIKRFFRESDVRELFVPIINDCNREGSK